MNKKIVTLILVILISLCFLSIVVADNATHDDNNTTDHNKTIDKNKTSDTKMSIMIKRMIKKRMTKTRKQINPKRTINPIRTTLKLKEVEMRLSLATVLEDLDLIIQNLLQVQEMNSNVSLHHMQAIQIH